MTPIQQATAAYFGISLKELLQGSRHPTIVAARHVSRYLERQRGLSLSEIGRLYGCDHTTVLASVNHMIDRLAANDSRYMDIVQAIASVVNGEKEKQQKENKIQVMESFACPTCGAPVIKELQRQIVVLHDRINELRKNGHG